MNTEIRIRKKAEELFWRYGIRSITMDEIATQLRISKKTIYQHYTDKDAIVDAVNEDQILFAQTNCLKHAAEAVNAIDEVFRGSGFIESVLRNMNPSLLFDLEKYHPRSYQKFIEHKNTFLFNMVKNNINRGIKEELFRPEINVEILSRFRLESMLMAFNLEIFSPTKFDLLQLQREMVEYFLYSAVTLKGHKLFLKYKEQRLNK